MSKRGIKVAGIIVNLFVGILGFLGGRYYGEAIQKQEIVNEITNNVNIEGLNNNPDIDDIVRSMQLLQNKVENLEKNDAKTLETSEKDEEETHLKNDKYKSVLDNCPPYKISDGVYIEDSLSMAGNLYRGMEMTSDNGYALINLGGGFSEMRFTLGHLDDSGMYTTVVRIYLDDFESAPAYEFKVNPESLPEEHAIQIDNALSMKISTVQVESYTPHAYIGICNWKIS